MKSMPFIREKVRKNVGAHFDRHGRLVFKGKKIWFGVYQLHNTNGIVVFVRKGHAGMNPNGTARKEFFCSDREEYVSQITQYLNRQKVMAGL